MWCFPSCFGSTQLKVWEEMSFEEFQDGHHGSHLGYQNEMMLAILNLYDTPMPPIKFQLNLTYDLGDAVWRISRWLAAILDIRTECHLKNFKIAAMAANGSGGDVIWRISRWLPWPPAWISEPNDFNNSESLCHWMPPIKIWLTVWEMSLNNFKMVAILDIGTEGF